MATQTHTLSAEEQKVYDNIVKIEKLGGSEAYLQAITSSSLLLRHDLAATKPLGLEFSVDLKYLKVSSSWGTISIEAEIVDNHHCSGSGLGFISKDVDIQSGTLYYTSSWAVLMAPGCTFTTAGADGILFIYFSVAGGIPAGFIKVTADFGASVSGSGTSRWTVG